MKQIVITLIFLNSILSCGQTILNSERILSKIDSSMVFGTSLDGDFSTGNINLINATFSSQLGKKIDNHLIRLIYNYTYTSENKEILSDDSSGQIRYNYLINDNSYFVFFQAQNVKSLNINNRILFGGGYRNRLIGNIQNYTDISLGIFKENEDYNIESGKLKIRNFRYSLSILSQYKLSEKISLNNTLYYQLNTKNIQDYRIFIEPRLSISFEKLNLFITTRNRFHSMPYLIDLKSNDNNTSFGLEYIL